MIEITILMEQREDLVLGYEMEGHAGYADIGDDIVCAAVSVLGQTTLISFLEIIKLDEEDLDYNIDNTRGYLGVKINKSVGHEKLKDSQVVLKTLIAGIESIQVSYPGYITLGYREV